MAKQDQPPPPPPVKFSGSGKDPQAAQANAIQARQSPGHYHCCFLFADAAVKRAEQILLDFTKDKVTVRYRIDGVWHNLPPRDRQSGDMMLAMIKLLAGLNAADRRSRQEGDFGVEYDRYKLNGTLASQGVPTGERALVKLAAKKRKPLKTLLDCGMREKMFEQYREIVNQTGGYFFIFSAMPGDGLTTMFRAGLDGADRFVRDFIQIQPADYADEEVINVDPRPFDKAKGETPLTLMPDLLLKEPDVFVVPELTDGPTVNRLCELVVDDERPMPVLTRLHAKESSEALLRVMALKCEPGKFAKAVTAVLYQRLVRKLCSTCKQQYKPQPQLLQKLGLPPGRINVLYRKWQPPPPPPPPGPGQKQEPQPEPQICGACGGIGYRGRTAIFELLIVSDAIRKALVQKPTLDVLRKLAKQSGHRSLQEEGILKIALGETSIEEVQRVLKQ